MRFRGDFLKGLRLQKKGFDCNSIVFYCFQLKSYLFDIKHAKCDLTAKSKRKMRLGSILARAAFCPNWVTSQFTWFFCVCFA